MYTAGLKIYVRMQEVLYHPELLAEAEELAEHTDVALMLSIK